MARHRPTRRPWIAMPTAHLMALAPLDIWLRMLIIERGVHPRYWIRTAIALVCSFSGMACCVIERVVLCPFRLIRFNNNATFDHPAGVVIVVGYYRSGTTQLHNLLSCDPNVVTPRWFHVLAPQGFWFGWSLVRVMLVPFLGNTRPQDGVAFGAEWPAEDDFAMCNWGLCSTLPGRFVFPMSWDRWARWNTLDECSAREQNRWRSLTSMFCWKITRGRRDRVLVLKTPSHTGRVAELDRLFCGRARFVHIARDPEKVIESNVNMHLRLSAHQLEDGPDVQTIRRRIAEEYRELESACASELDQIPEERVARIRHQDLVNDPIGVLRGVYARTGLDWDARVQTRMSDFVCETGEYRTPTSKRTEDLGSADDAERVMIEEFNRAHRLGDPAIDRVDVVSVRERLPISQVRGVITSICVTLGFVAIWIGVIVLFDRVSPEGHHRVDQLVWLMGACIGIGARRGARGGTRVLGVLCVVWMIIAWAGVLYFSAALHWDHGNGGWNTFYHNCLDVWNRARSSTVGTFGVLGMITAYRHASRNGPDAPGR